MGLTKCRVPRNSLWVVTECVESHPTRLHTADLNMAACRQHDGTRVKRAMTMANDASLTVNQPGKDRPMFVLVSPCHV